MAVENGKPVLKNICNEVEVTIFFAEEEPARNAKEACLSIIGGRYSGREVVLITGEIRKKSYQPTHIEPEVLFRMLFIGYLYGIRSEIRLLKEIEVNVAYRWFIGYDLTEKLPDVSVIWQNRLRRYKGTDVPQQIFDEIVRQANQRFEGEIRINQSGNLLWTKDGITWKLLNAPIHYFN